VNGVPQWAADLDRQRDGWRSLLAGLLVADDMEAVGWLLGILPDDIRRLKIAKLRQARDGIGAAGLAEVIETTLGDFEQYLGHAVHQWASMVPADRRPNGAHDQLFWPASLAGALERYTAGFHAGPRPPAD
jgi:hypothetical protein